MPKRQVAYSLPSGPPARTIAAIPRGCEATSHHPTLTAMPREIQSLRSSVLLFLVVLTSPGCAAGDRPDVLALATAGTGGVYYVLGGSIAELWSRDLPAHDFVAEVTGGSVENLSLLLGGEVQVAFSMGTSAHEVFYATGSFSEREPGQVLALTALYPNVLHLITVEGTGVEGLVDVVGRRVSVGAPGSGTEVAARTLLAGNGIDYEDFQPQRLNFNETASALRDGNIDAGFVSAGPPTSAIVDLATARPVRLVPIGVAEVENTAVLDPTVIRDVFLPGYLPRTGFRGGDTEYAQPPRGSRRHAGRTRLRSHSSANRGADGASRRASCRAPHVGGVHSRGLSHPTPPRCRSLFYGGRIRGARSPDFFPVRYPDIGDRG